MLKIKYEYFCSFPNDLAEIQSSKSANESPRATRGIQNQSEAQEKTRNRTREPEHERPKEERGAPGPPSRHRLGGGDRTQVEHTKGGTEPSTVTLENRSRKENKPQIQIKTRTKNLPSET